MVGALGIRGSVLECGRPLPLFGIFLPPLRDSPLGLPEKSERRAESRQKAAEDTAPYTYPKARNPRSERNPKAEGRRSIRHSSSLRKMRTTANRNHSKFTTKFTTKEGGN
jgi:hypothetical protein